jgi:hypothetical protein
MVEDRVKGEETGELSLRGLSERLRVYNLVQ